jgi:hypothetical protein
MDGKKGLSFEVVASREIHFDEEIFIDYGPVWEAAWNDHVKAWGPPKGEKWESYIPITKMNKEHLRSEHELKENPYAQNVQLVCYYEESDDNFNEDTTDMYISNDISIEHNLWWIMRQRNWPKC